MSLESGTQGMILEETAERRRELIALRTRAETAERLLTDEQAAHRLTAETLAKAIRDGDKAEQYRVQRDKMRKALEVCAATIPYHEGNDRSRFSLIQTITAALETR